jgi:rhodanese-related sulfurtransferase
MLNMFQSGPKVARIAPQDAIAKVADETLTLVDIRDPAERAMSGMAKGAVAIPLSTFQMKADPRSPEHHEALKTDKPIALYCASGARSQMAAQAMLQMGYTEVYNLGGLQDWARAGGEVT